MILLKIFSGASFITKIVKIIGKLNIKEIIIVDLNISNKSYEL